MKAFPLIYSRILKDDYPNGFLARPADLDVSAASKYVIPAMENIMHAGGIRHTVFPAGDYLIYGGVACVASELVKCILRNQSIDFSYKEYQTDKAGRPLIFFIGFAMRKYELVRNELPDIDLYCTYQIYLSYLTKQWRSDKAVTEISEGFELGVRPYTMKPAPRSFVAGCKHILCNYRENDFQEVVDYHFACMAWGRSGDFSFLSNVLADDVAQSPFAHISVYDCSAEECVRRMGVLDTSVRPESPAERGVSEFRTNNILDKQIADVSEDSLGGGIKSSNAIKKKVVSLSVRRIVAALAVLVIIVFLLLLSKAKKAHTSHQDRAVQTGRCSTVAVQTEEDAGEFAVLQAGGAQETVQTILEGPQEELLLDNLTEVAEALRRTAESALPEDIGDRI